MFRSRFILCAFVICTLGCPPTGPQRPNAGRAVTEPVTEEGSLRYKFKEGEKLRYEFEQSGWFDLSLDGREKTMGSSQTFDMVMSFGKVNKDGKAAVVYTFPRIRMIIDGPEGKTAIDTQQDSDPSDPTGKNLATFLRVLTGSEINATIDPLGRYSNVKLPEKVTHALEEAQLGPGGIGNIFTEHSLTGLLGKGGLVLLPERAPTIGASWASGTETGSGMSGRIVSRIEYTYEGVISRGDRELYKISLIPTMTTDTNNNDSRGMKLKSQGGSGSAYLDCETGWPVETILVQDVSIGMNIGNREVTQKMRMSVRTKLVEPAK
jgi:hypothetical protein